MGKAIRKRERTQAIQKACKELSSGLNVRVGWFESAKYPNGMPVAYNASIHEFGGGHVPPRPFMRPTAEEQRGEWAKQFGRAAKAITDGKIDASAAFEQLGGMVAGDIRKTITAITAPPLKESTIAAKRRKRADKKTTGNLSKPLIDTGLMLASLTHVVGTEE
jgi:hypothetical protein